MFNVIFTENGFFIRNCSAVCFIPTYAHRYTSAGFLLSFFHDTERIQVVFSAIPSHPVTVKTPTIYIFAYYSSSGAVFLEQHFSCMFFGIQKSFLSVLKRKLFIFNIFSFLCVWQYAYAHTFFYPHAQTHPQSSYRAPRCTSRPRGQPKRKSFRFLPQ